LNLAERRVLNDFQTNTLPAIQTRISEAAGVDIPLEVNWESLCVPGESHLYGASWTMVYFEPLIHALKTVGSDKIGLDAINAGLKKIVVQNIAGLCYGDRWASISDGVLTLDHEPITNVDQVDDRIKGLVQVLESGL